jgi:hypothetical protein
MNRAGRGRTCVCHLLWWLLLPAATLWAAEEAPPLGAGRPGAPVSVHWLEWGQDGRISVEVTPAIDYGRLELRLLIPGLDGPPAPMILSGGNGGVVRRAGWLLAAPPPVRPRLLVILETNGQRLGRTVSAPEPQGAVPGPAADEHGVIDTRGQQQSDVDGDAGHPD